MSKTDIVEQEAGALSHLSVELEAVDRLYSDFIGEGNTKDDIKRAIEKHGKPVSIFLENYGFMAALVYADKVVCVGYDYYKYRHTFVMRGKIPLTTKPTDE